jgi:hypothetical protein
VPGLIRSAPHIQTEGPRRRRQPGQPVNPFAGRGPGTRGEPHPRDLAGHDDGNRRGLVLPHLALGRHRQFPVRAGRHDARQPVQPALPQLAAVVPRSRSWSGFPNSCQLSSSPLTDRLPVDLWSHLRSKLGRWKAGHRRIDIFNSSRTGRLTLCKRLHRPQVGRRWAAYRRSARQREHRGFSHLLLVTGFALRHSTFISLSTVFTQSSSWTPEFFCSGRSRRSKPPRPLRGSRLSTCTPSRT